ncbi:MAG TPA: DUF6259 domain-containing protein [Candidatus Brocadiia bacterium]|nr:DUF6259 domain-containing protein [Candidatus Brocadiia bacterium]
MRAVRCHTMSLLGVLVCVSAAFAYEPQTDATAYRIILWENGDPAKCATVTGAWDKVGPDGRAGHPQCNVRVSREPGANGVHWRIEVKPKAAWGVAEVHYPILLLPKLPDDYLVVARRVGQRWPMSFATRKGDMPLSWSSRSEMQGIPDLQNKKAFFWARYPSSDLTFQMIAYENDAEGCMIWTPDPEIWVKDFILSNEVAGADKACLAYVCHFPEDTGQKGTAFHSPYPVVTTSYNGGWFNAAMIYRDWALKQWWCAKGKIHDRPATPAWYKDLHMWGGAAGDEPWIRQSTLPMARKVMQGRSWGAQLMNWSHIWDAGMTASPLYLPAANHETFPAFIKDLSAEKAFLAPYFMFSGATTQSKEVYSKVSAAVLMNPDGAIPTMYFLARLDQFLERRAAQGRLLPSYVQWGRSALKLKEDIEAAWNGPVNETLIKALDHYPMLPSERAALQKSLRESWGKDPAAISRIRFYNEFQKTDLAHKPFLEYCVAQVDKAIRDYGLSAVYFDTFPHSAIPCYNKAHGHPLGYGRHMARSSRDLCQRLLQKHPSLIIVCESGAGEHLMDSLHLTYHKGIYTPYCIPLFAAVYQGYLDYTNWWMWPPYDRLDDFASSLAHSIHLGYMPGGAVAGGLIPQLGRPPEPEVRQDPKVNFLQATMDARAACRDYIVAGRRMQDPVLVGPPPRKVKWGQDTSYYAKHPNNSAPQPVEMMLSPVQASRWRKNGDPAKDLLLFSNDSGQNHTVTADGLTVEVPAYSWKTVEIPASLPRPLPAARSSPAPVAQAAALPLAVGRIVEINKALRVLAIEQVTQRDGKRVRKTLRFQFHPATKFENAALDDLSLGDLVEVCHTRPAALAPGLDGAAERVVFDPKGRKEEEG